MTSPNPTRLFLGTISGLSAIVLAVVPSSILGADLMLAGLDGSTANDSGTVSGIHFNTNFHAAGFITNPESSSLLLVLISFGVALFGRRRSS